MMPGSKGMNPHELAHKWMKDIERIVGVHSTEQSIGIKVDVNRRINMVRI